MSIPPARQQSLDFLVLPLVIEPWRSQPAAREGPESQTGTGAEGTVDTGVSPPKCPSRRNGAEDLERTVSLPQPPSRLGIAAGRGREALGPVGRRSGAARQHFYGIAA